MFCPFAAGARTHPQNQNTYAVSVVGALQSMLQAPFIIKAPQSPPTHPHLPIETSKQCAHRAIARAPCTSPAHAPLTSNGRATVVRGEQNMHSKPCIDMMSVRAPSPPLSESHRVNSAMSLRVRRRTDHRCRRLACSKVGDAARLLL